VVTERKRVILVEDDEITRSHLEEAIRSCPELQLVASGGDVSAGRAALESHQVDVLLTDLGLPDGSGIELIEQAAAGGDVLCLVVTVFGDERHVVQAIEAGAMGYLLKDQVGADVGRAMPDTQAQTAPAAEIPFADPVHGERFGLTERDVALAELAASRRSSVTS
jgi:DNA-binding NarL/FixJ family response regulator